MSDRRDEIISEQLGKYSLNPEHIYHGTDVIPHALRLAMDEYFTERSLELLEYVAKNISRIDRDGDFIGYRGDVFTKEQLFENFL